MSKTEILWSNFEITNSESERQQSTLQLNESELFYQQNFVSFVKYHKRL
jgi:hypothetical protein